MDLPAFPNEGRGAFTEFEVEVGNMGWINGRKIFSTQAHFYNGDALLALKVTNSSTVAISTSEMWRGKRTEAEKSRSKPQ